VTASVALVDGSWTHLRSQVRRMIGARVASAADAEDVVQDVLLKVFRNTGGLRDGERFGGWLSTMVKNATADHLRDRLRHPVVPGDAAERFEGGDAADALADDDARRCLTAALRPFADRLPAIYREVIVLSELEGVPHAEIAKRLAISVSGVKSRVQRGREQLGKMLAGCCQIELDARRSVVACEPGAGEIVRQCCPPGSLSPD
jgi:RNA polymerase sigma-70 factor, ECF subfamily